MINVITIKRFKSLYFKSIVLRATIEVLVTVGDMDELIVALIDDGLEMKLMSKDLYLKQRWPINIGT